MKIKRLQPRQDSILDKAEEKLAKQRNQIEVLQEEIDKISSLMKNIQNKLDASPSSRA